MSSKSILWALVTVALTACFVFLWKMEESSVLPTQTEQAQEHGEKTPSEESAPLQAGEPVPASTATKSGEKLEAGAVQPVPPTAEQDPALPEFQENKEGDPSASVPAPLVPGEAAPVPPSDGTAAPATPPPSEDKVDEDIIKGTLNKGDTISKLLEPHADNESMQGIITATRQVFPLTSFRAGQPYVVICDVESGAVKRFEYEIDQKRRLVVEGLEEGSPAPVARVELIEYDVHLELLATRIDDNLFQAVADLGESPQLALVIANLFGWEINFIRDLQDGDAFSVLVEKLYRDGQFRGYGRTLGATFTNKGKTYEAFLFYDHKGREHHYNVRGENLRKILLQAPLSFTRVTSGYTKSRKHPIFGNHRAHFGVDYGAPTGTPVKAVGDGVVTLRGWVGGYGNQVMLRHAAGLESMYSHLSGFARGIAKGTRVRQGQVIAYVGSTGNSTGPHLDFRLKQNGNFINPTKAVNPRSEPVGKPNMKSFAERMELVRSYMNGSRPVDTYDQDEVAVPTAVQAAGQAAAKAAVEETKEEPKEKKTRKKRRNRRSE